MIHLDRFATVSVVQPLMNGHLLHSKPGIPILMYHSVSADAEPGVAPYYRLTTSPARFRDQMRWLREGGYQIVDLTQALNQLSNGASVNSRTVVLTFDDGFRDFHTHAWPILAELGFTATMFLPTEVIGSTRLTFMGRECLTWAEVRELDACGAKFGAHTLTHPKLYGMAWPDIRRELRDSRIRIEGEVQRPVDTFAYPYAFPQEDREFCNRYRDELREAGYSASVTTMIGRAKPLADPFILRRLPINEADDARLFMSKLAGAYDWVGAVQLFARRLKPGRR